APPEPPAKEHRVIATGDLGEVQKAWPRLLVLLKKKHQRSIAAFLQEAQASALDGNTLTLSFAPGFAFHREQLSDGERLGLVEECLAEVTGRPLKVKLEKDAGDAAGKRAEKTSRESSSDASSPGSRKPKTPGVQRAVEMFGGRVVEEEG
ncbi:MAG TPA: hypothetical protein VMY39_08960, partial [Planctomycetota bacterium]|nr:hypothetical protein [Planctomycetota bacterium]